ncbi:unnamed protein product, partial [Urochloa humidicola]
AAAGLGAGRDELQGRGAGSPGGAARSAARPASLAVRPGCGQAVGRATCSAMTRRHDEALPPADFTHPCRQPRRRLQLSSPHPSQAPCLSAPMVFSFSNGNTKTSIAAEGKVVERFFFFLVQHSSVLGSDHGNITVQSFHISCGLNLFLYHD